MLKQLNTTTDGLTSHEAKKRLAQYGPNAIPEQKRNNLLDFLKRYWGPMPWLLELAIVLTLILGHDTESIIIFVLLTINAVIGFVQSNNSQKAVALLKKKLDESAKKLAELQTNLSGTAGAPRQQPRQGSKK